MTDQLITYTIPKNPDIKSGPIYTLYLNKNTNLDLSSILNVQTISIKDLVNSNQITNDKITISQEDYTKLLELNNQAYQLSNKRTQNIQRFIQEETNTTKELTEINTKRQELIKKLTKKGDSHD